MPNDITAQPAIVPVSSEVASIERPHSTMGVNPTASPAPVRAAQPAPQPVPEPQPVLDDLPEKFRGKDAKAIVAMYTNLESDRGRMANELGQLRAVVDELLRNGAQGPATAAKPAEPAPVTNDALLSDPDKVIKETATRVAKDQLQATEDRLTKMEFEAATKAFESRFPTYQATMADDGFRKWVEKSKLRQGLATACIKGNFDAAHELFGMWDEVQELRTTMGPGHADKAMKEQNAIHDASTVRPGVQGPQTSQVRQQVATSNKPVLRKAELRKLFMNDRAEYNRRFDEIMTAYREKRVI